MSDLKQEDLKTSGPSGEPKTNWVAITVAVIGAAGAVIAAVVGILPGVLGQPGSGGPDRRPTPATTAPSSPAAGHRHHATPRPARNTGTNPAWAGFPGPTPPLNQPGRTRPHHRRHRRTRPPETPSPAPGVYAETVGGDTHTWTDYTDAGGTEGATIPAYTTVNVSCRIQGFAVQDGNTWWYRIASSPWSDSFYASADAFYNNGETSGPLTGTPFYDPNVRIC